MCPAAACSLQRMRPAATYIRCGMLQPPRWLDCCGKLVFRYEAQLFVPARVHARTPVLLLFTGGPLHNQAPQQRILGSLALPPPVPFATGGNGTAFMRQPVPTHWR